MVFPELYYRLMENSFNIKESWILNKRPKNERKKETRSSQSTSCTTVLKTLIIRYRRYKEYTEPFNGEIYWKAFSFLSEDLSFMIIHSANEVIHMKYEELFQLKDFQKSKTVDRR